MGSLGPAIAGGIARGQETRAAAAEMGFTPREYRGALRSTKQVSALGRKQVGLERKAISAIEGEDYDAIPERRIDRWGDQWEGLQKRREAALGRAREFGAPTEWLPEDIRLAEAMGVDPFTGQRSKAVPPALTPEEAALAPGMENPQLYSQYRTRYPGFQYPYITPGTGGWPPSN